MEKQLDLLNTQLNAEEAHKQDSSKLIDRKPIEGTPFTLISTPEKAFISMGVYRISPELKSPQEAEIWLQQNTINAIATMTGIIAEKVLQNHINEQTQKMTAFGNIEKEKEKRNGL